MFGTTEIYTALNVSAITNLLDTYKTGKALFSDLIAPSDFTGDDYINFYMVSPFNGAREVKEYTYSVNCRSNTYKKSLTMAYTVLNELNRAYGSDSYMTVTVLQTLPPADETDVYNTPVNIKLKTR